MKQNISKGNKTVDIKEVFSSKNPRLAKVIPGFVFRYIKRIIHEDFINYFLDKYGDKYGVEFADASIEDYQVTVKTVGMENVPKEGRFIFAANHPLGGFDGIIFIHLLAKMGFKIKVLVNDLLMNIRNLGPVFIPVNKHGGLSREVIDKIDEAFESDTQLLTFPSGMVSRRIKGKITDLEWHKSFIVKAIKHERDVIPVHFSGRNSSFFYNLYSLRKFFGIKANLEMFYLMDETQKHRKETITVTFGKPISFQVFDKSRKAADWAALVKDHVYKLPGNSQIDFKA